MDFWDERNSWSFTVIRAKGFQGLRPEKAWRPIVHVTVDDHLSHEINLGCDGQNPNLKQPFLFFPSKEKTANSKVNVSVFHRSQSKKKAKKRNLVATASLSLEDLLKMQGSDRSFEIKLNAGSTKLRMPIRRQSSPPCLIARLSPPNLPSTSTLSRPPTPVTPDSETLLGHDPTDDDGEYGSDAESLSSERATEPDSPWDEDDRWPEPDHSGQHIKGYLSDSDDEKSVVGEDEPLLSKSRDSTLQDLHQQLRQRHPHHHHHYSDSEEITLNDAEEEESCGQIVDEVTITNRNNGVSMSISWIAASLLPQAYIQHHDPRHAQHVHYPSDQHQHHDAPRSGPGAPLPRRSSTFASISSISSIASIETVHTVVDSFSPYRALREASADAEFEHILARLQKEWTFAGGSLIALAGLDAAVFGFSSPSGGSGGGGGGGGSALFTVTPFAARMVALGAISSGLGLVIVAYLLLLYTTSSMDAGSFRRRALDVYSSYLFFCISARLPAVCMLISACALMAFLGSVAWSAWPGAVLVMCFLAGVVVSLQFIVYGVHCVAMGIARCLRALKRGLVWVFSRRAAPVAGHQEPEPAVREIPEVEMSPADHPVSVQLER